MVTLIIRWTEQHLQLSDLGGSDELGRIIGRQCHCYHRRRSDGSGAGRGLPWCAAIRYSFAVLIRILGLWLRLAAALVHCQNEHILQKNFGRNAVHPFPGGDQKDIHLVPPVLQSPKRR